MIHEDVGEADADKAAVEAVAEEVAVGDANDKVVDNITLIKWQVTMILTSWQKQNKYCPRV